MTRSHELSLEKDSFHTLCPETRALNFKSMEGGFQCRAGQKGSTALKQISSSEEAPPTKPTFNTSTSKWPRLHLACVRAQCTVWGSWCILIQLLIFLLWVFTYSSSIFHSKLWKFDMTDLQLRQLKQLKQWQCDTLCGVCGNKEFAAFN